MLHFDEIERGFARVPRRDVHGSAPPHGDRHHTAGPAGLRQVRAKWAREALRRRDRRALCQRLEGALRRRRGEGDAGAIADTRSRALLAAGDGRLPDTAARAARAHELCERVQGLRPGPRAAAGSK
eukprot:scaffold26804_cov53-Phaeocystis_antarctica.AAC.3